MAKRKTDEEELAAALDESERAAESLADVIAPTRPGKKEHPESAGNNLPGHNPKRPECK